MSSPNMTQGNGRKAAAAMGYRARIRTCGPPVAFLNTQWGRDEAAGKHDTPARPLRHKPSVAPLRPDVDHPTQTDGGIRRRVSSKTHEERTSYSRDEEVAYVVELRRPRRVVHVDVHAGKKHARRTPSPPRTIKRKRGFVDGRSLAKEGQHGLHSPHHHHKSPATASGSVPGLSPSRGSRTTSVSSVKTPSPAPVRSPLSQQSSSTRNATSWRRTSKSYYDTEYRYPSPTHHHRPANVLNAGLHPIDTGAGTSKEKRREGVACVDGKARAYGQWLDQENASRGERRSGRVSLGFSKMIRAGGIKEEMSKRMRRRGKGFGVFEWSPFA